MEVPELLEKIDIVEYISQFVELEERGSEFWGLSPFNEEKTPSFSVRRESGKFYCFSSGIGGSVITFAQRYFGISAHEAIEKLKEYAGVSDEHINVSEKLSATMTCKKYARPKVQAKEEKGVNLPDDYMDRYERRPDKLEDWYSEGISEDAIAKFQVRYDPFSDRIVYPIRDISGKIVNVSGRTLDPDYKEKGIRKYTYFHSFGTVNTIYGLWENAQHIRDAGAVILFEGCKSVLKAYGWGIKNCGAILTSHLSPTQVKILVKLGCRVVFALDKDVDISKDRNIKVLNRYANVEYIYDAADWLNDKDSPVDRGEKVFRDLYERRLKYR